jgi:hypothetical protein
VRVPGAKLEDVSEGGKALAGRAEFSGVKQTGDAVIVDVGSGNYTFSSSYTGGEKTQPHN